MGARASRREPQRLAYLAAVQGAVWTPIRVEARMRDLLGGADEQAGVVDWLTYVHPGDRPRLLDLRANRVRNPGPYRWRYRMLDDDGGTTGVEERGVTAAVKGARYAVGSIRRAELPVTRRSSSAQLPPSPEELQGTTREVSMLVFAHDVRGPLRSAEMLLTSLRDEQGTVDEHERGMLLGRLTAELARVQRLADDVFELERLTPTLASDGVERVDLAALASAAVVELDDERAVQLPSASVWVAVDRMLVKRALVNLLENGLRHAIDRVAVDVQRTAYGAVLVVEDDGPGVAVDERERVFETFIRLDPEGMGGLGLGLSLVRRIAELHGGQSWVEDSSLGGARFVLWLPDRARGDDVVAGAAGSASIRDGQRLHTPLTIAATLPSGSGPSPLVPWASG